MQQVTKLLLLAMFAFAARYLPPKQAQQGPSSSASPLTQAGAEYGKLGKESYLLLEAQAKSVNNPSAAGILPA